MTALLHLIRDHFESLAVLVVLPAGAGFYNLYRGYRLRRSSHDEYQLSGWFTCAGRMILLISLFLLLLLCGLGLFLGVQIPHIIGFLIASVISIPLFAGIQIFVMRRYGE